MRVCIYIHVRLHVYKFSGNLNNFLEFHILNTDKVWGLQMCESVYIHLNLACIIHLCMCSYL